MMPNDLKLRTCITLFVIEMCHYNLLSTRYYMMLLTYCQSLTLFSWSLCICIPSICTLTWPLNRLLPNHTIFVLLQFNDNVLLSFSTTDNSLKWGLCSLSLRNSISFLSKLVWPINHDWWLQYLYTKAQTVKNRPTAEAQNVWKNSRVSQRQKSTASRWKLEEKKSRREGGASSSPQAVFSSERMCRVDLLLPLWAAPVVLSARRGEDVMPHRSCATSPFRSGWIHFVPTALTCREGRKEAAASRWAGGGSRAAATGRDGDEDAVGVCDARVLLLLLQRCQVGQRLQLRR